MAGCTVETIAGVAVLSFVRPVLSERVLAELDAALDGIAAARPHPPVVLRSLHPTIFLAGAHLAEIAALDAGSSRAYALRGRAVLDRLAGMPGPTVAAVDGSCSGGGFDLALACDRVVAGAGASFGHPGVRRGLVTGWGGTARLPAVAGTPLARLAMIAALPLTTADLGRCGFAVAANGDVVEAALAEGRRLALLHPDRLRAWRAARDHRVPIDLAGHGL